MASGCYDSNIAIWNTSNFSRVGFLQYAHDDRITCIKWLGPDSGFFASAGDDYVIKIWDTRTFKFLRRLNGHSGRVNSLDVLSDGRLVSASSDNMMIVWNLNTSEPEYSYQSAFGGPFTSVKQSKINPYLIIVGESSDLIMFNMDQYRVEYNKSLTDSNGVKPNGLFTAALSGDGNVLGAVWSGNLSTIALFDIALNQLIVNIPVLPTHAIEFYPYGWRVFPIRIDFLKFRFSMFN